MAITIDEDGTETHGGIAAIRDAFVMSGHGQLVCTEARMGYDHSAGPNAQVLEFSGRFAVDGKPFAVKSNPILPGAPLAPVARKMARDLVAQAHSSSQG